MQRQSLFDENDARESLPKAIAAQRKLNQVNSDVRTEGVVADATSRNIETLVRGFDVILDGTDNFETRYLLNDTSVKLGIPWIYGAVVGSSAVTMTILPGQGPCLSCIFPDAPAGLHETCDTVGVIGPAAAWTSAIQVTEALKILLGRKQDLHRTLLGFDIWHNRMQQIEPKRDRDCKTCGQRIFTYLEEGEPLPAVLCGRDAVQIRHRDSRRLDMALLKARLERFGTVRANDFLLKFCFDGYELTVFPDGRAIIKGTQDPAVARGLYAKYVSS